ncbi:hypothetical protein [Chamaesiphon polymorphus]|uniref:Uncharacterized protein n=1 Tax=Chamaesiphon polymorphus CCALA 037 TaxID=2107692 RepID=A0A2T1G634_9CYAN|nr:hypothetical protein [Chamaesiphon polymorphus]PSB52693.1 hypothetical protein C7B77_20230 [Chamaesiphon polymorphus CCALA 037]
MFRVFAKDYDRQFERWTDALEAGNSLKSQCKSLLQDVRIFDGEELIWIYSRSHTYPQYIGAGVYDKLARLFLIENAPTIEVEVDEPEQS